MLLRLLSLPAYPLTDNTESRYAEVAREMVVSGDWVTPRLGGQPFWAKPPMSIWASALGIKVFGVNEFATRLPEWLFGLAVLGLTCWAGRRVFGPTGGYLSMTVLVSMPLFLLLAGGVMTDPAFGFTTTLAMAAFIGAFTSKGKKAARAWGYTFFLALALGLLAKGPVVLVLTGLAVFIWVVWKHKWRALWEGLPWISGTLLMLLIAVPWFLIAEQHSPGFLNYYLVGEHFHRFIEHEWKGDLYGAAHSRPKGMIWAFWLLAALPWSLAFMAGLTRLLKSQRQGWKDVFADPMCALLLAWALAPMVFFTLSGSILPTYVYPGLPAMAILMAGLLTRRTAVPPETQRPARLFISLTLLAPLIAAGLLFYGYSSPEAYDGFTQKRVVDRFHELAEPGSTLAYANRNVPYSASFYAGTRAVHPLTNTDWLALSDNGVRDFVVSDDEDFLDVPVEYRLQLEQVDKYADRWLWMEKSPVTETR